VSVIIKRIRKNDNEMIYSSKMCRNLSIWEQKYEYNKGVFMRE